MIFDLIPAGLVEAAVLDRAVAAALAVPYTIVAVSFIADSYAMQKLRSVFTLSNVSHCLNTSFLSDVLAKPTISFRNSIYSDKSLLHLGQLNSHSAITCVTLVKYALIFSPVLCLLIKNLSQSAALFEG